MAGERWMRHATWRRGRWSVWSEGGVGRGAMTISKMKTNGLSSPRRKSIPIYFWSRSLWTGWPWRVCNSHIMHFTDHFQSKPASICIICCSSMSVGVYLLRNTWAKGVRCVKRLVFVLEYDDDVFVVSSAGCDWWTSSHWVLWVVQVSCEVCLLESNSEKSKSPKTAQTCKVLISAWQMPPIQRRCGFMRFHP